MRQKPGAHLSSDGVELATFAGTQMGHYDRVITSTLPRSVETAVAMGYEVNACIEELGKLPDEILAKLDWPNTLQSNAAIIHTNRECSQFASKQTSIWFDCIRDLPDGGKILIISHGGIMELGALGSMHSGECKTFVGAFGYCEGFSLEYEGEFCTGMDFILMPTNRRLIDSK